MTCTSLYLYFVRPFPVDKKEPGEGEDGGGKEVQEAMWHHGHVQ